MKKPAYAKGILSLNLDSNYSMREQVQWALFTAAQTA